MGAYKDWWGDGPPFHHHWGLEDCRRVLAAVGEPEPMLPSCDLTKIVPFDFEADVERLIETTLAKKAEHEKKRPREKQKSTFRLLPVRASNCQMNTPAIPPAGYRVPAAAPAGTAAEIRTTSSGDSFTVKAPTFSSSRAA